MFKPGYKTSLFFIVFLLNSLTLKAQIQTDNGVADTTSAHAFTERIKLLIPKNRWDSILIFNDSATSLFLKAGYTQRYLNCMSLRCKGLFMSGKYDATEKLLINTIAECKGEKLLQDLPFLYNLYGTLLITKGDLTKAKILLDSARKIIEDSGDTVSFNMAENLSFYGNLYKFMRNYSIALDYLVRASQIFTLSGYADHYSSALNSMFLGELYGGRGENDKALFYFGKCLEYSQKHFKPGNYFFHAVNNDIALVYLQMGEYEKSRELFKKTLERYKSRNDTAGIMTVSNNIGYTFYLQKKYQEAIDLFKDLEEHYLSRIGYRSLKVRYPLILLGKSYAETGQYHEAVRTFDKLVKSLSNSSDTVVLNFPNTRDVQLVQELFNASIYKTRCLYMEYLGNHERPLLEASWKGCQFVMELMQKVPYEVVDADAPFQLLDEFSGFFPLGMIIAETYYGSKDSLNDLTERLFQLSEQSHASLLFSAICQSRAMKFSGLPESIQQTAIKFKTAKDAISIRISAKESRPLRTAADSLELNQLIGQRFSLERNYSNAIAQIQKNYPAYSRMRYNTGAITTDEAGRSLPDSSSVMLEYFLSDTCIYTFVITKKGSTCVKTPVDSAFHKMTGSFLASIRKLNTDQYCLEAYALYSKLILPVEPLIRDAKHLIIIPHMDLAYLPFEALLTSEKNIGENDFSKMDFLIRKYSIAYHYSASLWAESEKNKNRHGGIDLMAMAPVFGSPEMNDKGRAPLTNPDLTVNRHAPMRDSSGNYIFAKLAYSEKEVRSVIKICRAKGWKAKGYLYSEATEERFRKEAKNHNVIHIASHSFVNETDPGLSGIAFYTSKGDSNADHRDGILNAAEAYNVRMNADLLVLSSCESGIGKLARGEGIMSLTRGFLYSGCNNILYSLWKVEDKSTSVLMERFYSSITRKLNFSEALRKAKLKMIDNPVTSFPSSWAGFVLVGSN